MAMLYLLKVRVEVWGSHDIHVELNENFFGNNDIWLFAGRVRRNADGTPVQPLVSFRPLLGIHITSAVHGSELAPCRLVTVEMLSAQFTASH
ncbi:hypothetical protein HAX54_039381 [Datura stramonium]|uniref:Uncharacterized protein n=1 Tax=Datura stramonium TaxID=4076 RepID=A0ABS8VQF1_DATST|nr:hypothetical protein [Datura stramonium]